GAPAAEIPSSLTTRSDMAPTTDDLWAAYKATGNLDARNELVFRYAHVLRFCVSRIASRLPHYIDRDDLVQEGWIGMLNAMERFDPGRGLRFETYAPARIEGAIRDAHREHDWAPRSVRTNARRIDAAMSKLEAALGRSPTDDEIARELGWDPSRYRRAVDDIWRSSVLAMEDVLMVGRDAGEGTRADALADLSSPDPVLQIEEREQREV